MRSCSGQRMLLDADEGFEVLAEAGDFEAMRRFVRAYRPRVLVVDLSIAPTDSRWLARLRAISSELVSGRLG
jgi:hypothetical protein